MVVIGIAGGTCSGKTTLADRVRKRLGKHCTVLPLDNYYVISELPFEERALLNHDVPESIDWPLVREHVEQLIAGRLVHMPVYSFRRHKRTEETTELAPAQMLIIEGIHAWHDPKIRQQMRLKVFLDSSPDERKHRRIERDLQERCADIEFVVEKFENQTEATFVDFEQEYKSTADIVADNLDDAENRIIGVMS